ncbi:MAG: hypothetical protein ABI528_10230, partial [bacterium]
MKYLFLILFAANFSLAQNIYSPDSYKISVNEFKNFDLKKNRNSSVAETVVPVYSATPISNFITDILLNGDTIWFATGSGIMKSVDNLSSFLSYAGLSPFGNDDISGFNINRNILVVATAVSQEINGSSVPTGTGIKVSSDNGVSWSSYPQPVDERGDSTIVYGSNVLYSLPVVVRQQNLSYDIAITKTQNDLSNYTIWICSFAGGLRKSTDYGATWQRVLLPPDNLDSININTTGYTFALNPRD